jgi:hypothetical protein
MRAKYDSTRAVQLQRTFPEAAKIGIKAKRSNGRGTPRVFHHMNPGAIKNKIRMRDPEMVGRVKLVIEEMIAEWSVERLKANRVKVLKRAEDARVSNGI